MSVSSESKLYAIYAIGNPYPSLIHGWANAVAHFYRLYAGATAAWNTPWRMCCLNDDARFDFREIAGEWRRLGWPVPRLK
jgi:hypothetical protein